MITATCRPKVTETQTEKKGDISLQFF